MHFIDPGEQLIAWAGPVITIDMLLSVASAEKLQGSPSPAGHYQDGLPGYCGSRDCSNDGRVNRRA